VTRCSYKAKVVLGSVGGSVEFKRQKKFMRMKLLHLKISDFCVLRLYRWTFSSVIKFSSAIKFSSVIKFALTFYLLVKLLLHILTCGVIFTFLIILRSIPHSFLGIFSMRRGGPNEGHGQFYAALQHNGAPPTQQHTVRPSVG